MENNRTNLASIRSPSAGRCFLVRSDDNVATALCDLEPGPARVIGSGRHSEVLVTECVRLGHKVAVAPIDVGQDVIKFGVPIGRAKSRIDTGSWVHLHNCASNIDGRSGTLELNNGAPKDTRYE